MHGRYHIVSRIVSIDVKNNCFQVRHAYLLIFRHSLKSLHQFEGRTQWQDLAYICIKVVLMARCSIKGIACNVGPKNKGNLIVADQSISESVIVYILGLIGDMSEIKLSCVS